VAARDLLPTVQHCELVFGPAETWKGNCYSVASKLVAAGLLRGEAVYGHWRGPVAPGSMFASRGCGFIRHGWVVLKGGRTIVDPTRRKRRHGHRGGVLARRALHCVE